MLMALERSWQVQTDIVEDTVRNAPERAPLYYRQRALTHKQASRKWL